PYTSSICSLSLHDALPISQLDSSILLTAGTSRAATGRRRDSSERGRAGRGLDSSSRRAGVGPHGRGDRALLPPPHARAGGRDRSDRKSTRLNSSHVKISYA